MLSRKIETVAKRETHGFRSGGTEFKILRILYVVRELTIRLQMQAVDVTYVNQQVTSVISILKKMREDSSSHFHTLFTETTHLGQQLHGDQFELSTPRTVGRQVHQVILKHPVQRTTFESLSLMNFSCYFSACG